MIEIGMNSISKNFGYKNILKDFNLEVITGDKVALVGSNGSGKSTILKIIAGEETLDKGSLSIRKAATIGLLDQIPKLYDNDINTKDVLLDSFSPLLEIKKIMERIELDLENEKDEQKIQTLMDRYCSWQNEFIAKDGYAMEENFSRIVRGFSIQELLQRPFNVLSGGQKTIVNLAATILRQPDILLLDEPTNHLDIGTLEWFEEFLSKYKGTTIIVSHDRYFLDKVANKTVLLDMGSAITFMGNYSFTLKEQERLLLLEFKDYKNQQKKISAMKAAIKRYRQWGTESDNAKFFKKAKELEKKLEKIQLIDRPQLEKTKLPISFFGERSGKEVLKLENFSLSKGDKELFCKADLLIARDERVCLSGDNGTGKTSLIKAIINEEKYGGSLTLGPSVKLGYIPQEIRFANEKDTVLEAFKRECVITEGEARKTLAKFFFYGENVFKSVGKLSGGEKVLLKLAMLMENETNFLILDEPTNHIDIDTREMLEEALLEFKGTLFFVSHDRYFINKIATEIVVIKDKSLKSSLLD